MKLHDFISSRAIINIINLKNSYKNFEKPTIKVYGRAKNWSPTIYKVANSRIIILTPCTPSMMFVKSQVLILRKACSKVTKPKVCLSAASEALDLIVLEFVMVSAT